MGGEPANSLLTTINHNPDVLSCLANLSNDEVFTPPAVANAMLDLLPQGLFRNPQAKFLDPVCKSGVFLREITKRLMAGLAKEFPDPQKRLDHILHNQVYGIAITELTSLIARRTLYCAKYATSPFAISRFENIAGNIRYKAIQHTFDKNGRCVYCGAAQSQYEREEGLESHAYEFIHTDKPQEIFKNMKFDVIIGNPPYQLNDGGGSNGISARPIYQYFIEHSKKLNPNYLCMIIPARWFSGGKGLTEFREIMKSDKHIKRLIFYPKSRECFPGVDIAGGICYFLRSKAYQGNCTFISTQSDRNNQSIRDLSEFDVIIGDNIGIQIAHKIRKLSDSFLDKYVLPRNSFGFTTSSRGKKEYFPASYKLISSEGITYIDKDEITKNIELADNYKVIVGTLNPDRGGVNNAKDGMMNVTTKIKILNRDEIPTETYIVVNNFNDKRQAINFTSYLATKFSRYLIALTISSMHIVKNNFQFVPLQDFSKPWTDAELYAKYNLSQEEIESIESMIRPMELSIDSEPEA